MFHSPHKISASLMSRDRVKGFFFLFLFSLRALFRRDATFVASYLKTFSLVVVWGIGIMKGFFFLISKDATRSLPLEEVRMVRVPYHHIRRYLLRETGTISAVRCGVVRYLDGECGLGWHVVVGFLKAAKGSLTLSDLFFFSRA